MPKPDVEMIHSKTGHIYFQGKIYDITRMANGWIVTRPMQFESLCIAPTIEDACAWLMTQQTV